MSAWRCYKEAEVPQPGICLNEPSKRKLNRIKQMIPHSLYVYAKIFFESFLVCLSRFMVVSAMSAQHGGYPACGGKGWERNANVLFFRFYLPPCVAAAKGEGGIDKKCKRPVLMFSCSHVLPLRRIPGLLIRFLGRLSLLLRLCIA